MTYETRKRTSSYGLSSPIGDWTLPHSFNGDGQGSVGLPHSHSQGSLYTSSGASSASHALASSSGSGMNATHVTTPTSVYDRRPSTSAGLMNSGGSSSNAGTVRSMRPSTAGSVIVPQRTAPLPPDHEGHQPGTVGSNGPLRPLVGPLRTSYSAMHRSPISPVAVGGDDRFDGPPMPALQQFQRNAPANTPAAGLSIQTTLISGPISSRYAAQARLADNASAGASVPTTLGGESWEMVGSAYNQQPTYVGDQYQYPARQAVQHQYERNRNSISGRRSAGSGGSGSRPSSLHAAIQAAGTDALASSDLLTDPATEVAAHLATTSLSASRRGQGNESPVTTAQRQSGQWSPGGRNLSMTAIYPNVSSLATGSSSSQASSSAGPYSTAESSSHSFVPPPLPANPEHRIPNKLISARARRSLSLEKDGLHIQHGVSQPHYLAPAHDITSIPPPSTPGHAINLGGTLKESAKPVTLRKKSLGANSPGDEEEAEKGSGIKSMFGGLLGESGSRLTDFTLM